MARHFKSLQAEIMNLPSADRARLIERLITSLERDDEAESAWDALAAGRLEELEIGKVHAESLEDVVARLEARFPGCRSRSTRMLSRT